MDKGGKKLASTYKMIDSKKVDQYITDNKINQTQLADRVGISRGYLREAIKRGNAQKATWGVICQEFGVPADYFDYVEPVPELKTETVPEKKAEEGDIKDLLVSMLVTQKKQEAILLKMADAMEKAWC